MAFTNFYGTASSMDDLGSPGSALGKRNLADMSPVLHPSSMPPKLPESPHARWSEDLARYSAGLAPLTIDTGFYDNPVPVPGLEPSYSSSWSSSWTGPYTPSSFSPGSAPYSPPGYIQYNGPRRVQRRLSLSGAGPLDNLPYAPPPPKANRKTRRRLPNSICTVCAADETPEWRRGPAGSRTLCNACGLAQSKLPNPPPACSLDELVGQLQAIGYHRYRNPRYQLPLASMEAAETAWAAAVTGNVRTTRYSSAYDDESRRSPRPPPIVTSSSYHGPSRQRGGLPDMEAAMTLSALSTTSPSMDTRSNSSSSSDSPRSPTRGMPGLRDYSLSADVSSAARSIGAITLQDRDQLDMLEPLPVPGSPVMNPVSKMNLSYITSAPISPTTSRRFSFHSAAESSSSYSEMDTSPSSGSRPVSPSSARRFSFGLKK